MLRYNRYLRQLSEGKQAVPRGLKANYIRDMVYTFQPGDMVRRFGDNPAIGFMEGLQFISGIFDHAAIAAIAPKAKLDLFTGQSAYGPRIVGQLEAVINELWQDGWSRRAVLRIAHHDDALADIPCTLAMQFHLEPYGTQRYLFTTVTMRSSDAIWGLPYDMLQFGVMAWTVAKCLKANPSTVTVNMGNAHLYEMNRPTELSAFEEGWKWTMPELDTMVPTVGKYIQWAQDLVATHPGRDEIMHVFGVHEELKSARFHRGAE